MSGQVATSSTSSDPPRAVPVELLSQLRSFSPTPPYTILVKITIVIWLGL